MDDRRFDSLVKALAEGPSRRSVLKGLLGLGGAALVGGVALDGGGTEAARRPTPTPTPVKCPGNQKPVGGVCTCPASAPNKCGPDCCTGKTTDPYPRSASHTECCDNACCYGTCYGEELCCPTNPRAGGLPPLASYCPSTKECCPAPGFCCAVDGCCDTVCTGGASGQDFCCAEASFCPGGSESADLCCSGGTTCCGGGTNRNVCIDPATQCCTDGDCTDPFCHVCDQASHTCQPRCGQGEVCCTEQAGPGVCQKGDCCPGAPCPGGGCQTCSVNPDTGIAGCTAACDPAACCNAGLEPPDWFCCDSGEQCCQDSHTCISVDGCCGDDIVCGDECCPEGRCSTQGCCPEEFIGCGDRCCRADVYTCVDDQCVCPDGTEACGQLPAGCCPTGQCNVDAGVCCDVGTGPCGDGCCPDGQCTSEGVCCTAGYRPSVDGCCLDGAINENGECCAYGPCGSVCCTVDSFCVDAGAGPTCECFTPCNGTCCDANSRCCGGTCIAFDIPGCCTNDDCDVCTACTGPGGLCVPIPNCGS